MKEKFCECIHDVQRHKNSGTPKFLIIRPTVENEKISVEDQQEYWLGVGKLLYLGHDLSNATMEMVKANDGANPAAYKELLLVIKYVLDMKNLGLKI